MASKYESILRYCKVITSKPNFKTNFFFLDEHCRMMMINAAKLPTVPFVIDHLMKQDEVWIFVDLEKTEHIRVFSYDVVNAEKNIFTNEKEMVLIFSILEDHILNFLIANIQFLCEHTNPVLEVEKLSTQDLCRTPYRSKDVENYRERQRGSYPAAGSSSYPYTNYNYNNSWSHMDFKEREDILNPLYDLVKNYRTGQAIDYIDQKFPDLFKQDKASLINSIFRLVVLEKLDVSTMLALVRVSHGLDEKFYDRKEFVRKIKQLLEKLRPAWADWLFDTTTIVPVLSTEEKEEEEEVEEAGQLEETGLLSCEELIKV
jgi:hypothetical protein